MTLTETGAPLELASFLAGSEVTDPHQVAHVENPADPTDLVGIVGLADRSTALAAVTAAAEARVAWARTDIHQRAQLLAETATWLQDQEQLTTLLSREHGKVPAEAAAELRGAAEILSWHANQAAALDPLVEQDERGRVVTRRVPMGVVTVIVPWNYPVLLAMLMLSPALLAGNTVVVKLPDHAPLTVGSALRRLASRLPAGVLNVLAGDGVEVGGTLTTHPLVRKVTFTGSTPTGRRIMRAASDTLKSLSLELGGNDAAVVLHDATIDTALASEL